MDRLLYASRSSPRRAARCCGSATSRTAGCATRPDWGRGRIDPFNPVKFRMLRQPIDDTIGNCDMVPVWNARRRNGQAYHWDGLNSSLREVVLSSALGDGATSSGPIATWRTGTTPTRARAPACAASPTSC